MLEMRRLAPPPRLEAHDITPLLPSNQDPPPPPADLHQDQQQARLRVRGLSSPVWFVAIGLESGRNERELDLAQITQPYVYVCPVCA